MRGDVQSGLLNCHHFGLHSLVLEKRPDGSLLRVFVTTPAHRLDRLFNQEGHFTLGAHNHDKTLDFTVLVGNVCHVSLCGLAVEPHAAHPLYRYRFGSAIEGGSFTLGQPERWSARIQIEPMDGTRMRSVDVHTVLVSSPWAAWAVDEGPCEDVEKAIYSPRPDLSVEKLGNLSQLYQAMTPGGIAALCATISREAA